MQITRQSEYALWIVIELASNEGSAVSIKQIAQKYRLPEEFLRKIVQSLCRAGLIETRRGAHGGLRLGKCPGRITVLDVISAMDGPMSINPCLDESFHCPRKPCNLHRLFSGLNEQIISMLSSIRIADIVQGD